MHTGPERLVRSRRELSSSAAHQARTLRKRSRSRRKARR